MHRIRINLKLSWMLMLLSMLAPLLMGVDQGHLVTITLVNKSGYPLGVRFTGAGTADYKNTYFFTLPTGTRGDPYEKSFEIMPDKYSVSVIYTQYYDPVYGFDCGAGAGSYYIIKDTRMNFLECGIHPRHRGETGIIKFNQPGYRHPNIVK